MVGLHIIILIAIAIQYMVIVLMEAVAITPGTIIVIPDTIIEDIPPIILIIITTIGIKSWTVNL